MLSLSTCVSKCAVAAASIFAICFASIDATAQELPNEVEVLGEVMAMFDGIDRTWLTFHFPDDGAHAAQASANWRGFDTSVLPDQLGLPDLGIDRDTMSAEEIAYLEMMSAQLAERQAAMMGDLAKMVEIALQAHDPDNPSLLTEGVLSLTPSGWDMTSDDWLDMVGVPVEAEILYIEESAGGLPSVIYTSDVSGIGEIVFDDLDFGSPFGMASGSFSGLLCRVDMQGLRITEDPDDCRSIEGAFETELFAVTQ